MTSAAPRIKRQSGPSWKSVAIHWTDSDAKKFEKVDGLPWIRKTDKSRLFNKNGILSVVDRYSSSDGVDPKRKYRHVGIIADAVEQPVLVEVVLKKDVPATPGPGWPKFRIWAFLQPPTIGHAKQRVAENGGWVVDDMPRAGWFEAVVDGATLKVDVMDFSRGHQSAPGIKIGQVWAERDPERANVVRFKIIVRVSNNESPDELRKKAEKLRKQKMDVSLVEAGSYLKVWVRNEERQWPMAPKDDDSEKILQSMADADLLKPGGGKDPRRFCNHTWKRSRLATHKSILGSVKNPDQNLLYVGLYPAEVIEKLEKLEKEAKEKPKEKPQSVEMGQAREFSFPTWLAVSMIYCILVFGLRRWRDKRAEKKGKGGQKIGKVEATEYIVGLAENLTLPDLFAAFAVAGLSDLPKIAETFKEAERHPDHTEITKKIYSRFLEAFLEMDAENQAAGAKKRAEDAAVKGLKKFKPEDIWKWGALWKEQAAVLTFQIIEGEDKSLLSLPKAPKPLPGWLAWLGYQFKITGSANAPVSILLDCSKAGTPGGGVGLQLSTQGKEKAGFSFKFALLLRALWSSIGEDAIKDAQKGKGKTPVLDTLKEVLEFIDVEFTMSLDLTNEALVKLGIQWTQQTKKLSSTGLDTQFLSEFKAKTHAQACVFQWDYEASSGRILDGDLDYCVYGSQIQLFGTEYPELRGHWGKAGYEENAFLTSNHAEKDLAICLGSRFDVYLDYTEAKDPSKCTVALRYRGMADNVNAMSKAKPVRGGYTDLQSDLPVVDHPPVAGAGKGRISSAIRLTWSDKVLPSEGGSIAFRSMLKEKRWELLQFFQTCFHEDSFRLSPCITTPEGHPFLLSPKSTLVFYSPKVIRVQGGLSQGGASQLVWKIQMSYYLDTHIWVRLKEHDWLDGNDIISIRGGDKANGWKLVELKGNRTLNSPREISIPLADILPIAEKESSYQFYLEFALLDDNSCILDAPTPRIEVPKSLLPGRG